MSTDYLTRLHEHLAQQKSKPCTPTQSAAKTDKTPIDGSFGSFDSIPPRHIQKKTCITPLPVTREWLEAQGCNDVLQMDLAHIKRHLPIGTVARNRVLLAYVDIWLAAAEAERAPYRKDNAGRRSANKAIREGRS